MSGECLAYIDLKEVIRGVTRTGFVFRSCEAAAIKALNRRPVIAFEDETWDAFATALDAPVDSILSPGSVMRASHTQWDR